MWGLMGQVLPILFFIQSRVHIPSIIRDLVFFSLLVGIIVFLNNWFKKRRSQSREMIPASYLRATTGREPKYVDIPQSDWKREVGRYIWLALAALLLLGAYFLWPTKEQKLAKDLKGYFKISEVTSSNASMRAYKVSLPMGSWFDTGLWITPNQTVSCITDSKNEKDPSIHDVTTCQPIRVRIGDSGQEFESVLNRKYNEFVCSLYASSKEEDDGKTTKEGAIIVYAENRQKLYLKIEDGTPASILTVYVYVSV
jgi:hypothetical protein